MAELLLTSWDLEALSDKTELPVTLSYAAGEIVVSGSFRHLWEQQFFARLRFVKFTGENLLLKITESKPSFGAVDALIKSWVMNKMTAGKTPFLEINYPILTVDVLAAPGADAVLNRVRINGIDFREEGINVRFEMEQQAES